MNFKNILTSLTFTLCLIGALISVNYIAYRFNMRWDVTASKQHTLTDYTEALLKDLRGDVKITAMYVGFPPKYLEDLLEEYERVSNGKVTARIIDPLVELSQAAQYGNVINNREKKLIVESGKERRDVDFTEEPLSEEGVNNALIRVTRPAQLACFLSGHSEYDIFSDESDGLNELMKKLLANNIISKKVLLQTARDVPAECGVLIVAGPRQHLPIEEEEAIDRYLKQGGDALFLVENVVVSTPDKPLTEEQEQLNPSLNNILKNWGVRVARDVVVDLTSHASGDVGSPATNNYMPHKAIIEGLDYTFYLRPRSVSMLPDRRPTLKVAPFILTASSENSWGETNRYLDIKFDEDVDRPGPVPIAYVMAEPVESEENTKAHTRIILITDADFLSNAYINYYSNAQMALNVINWLVESDYQVLPEQKQVEVSRLDLTSRQKKIIIWILVGIPALIMIAGAGLWIKYRD
ncbi:MAG: GldG family protein [Candidatus Omnitrophica bacterium]|nr:GldG family protein [Candidatus Omnitrophota bacterium]